MHTDSNSFAQWLLHVPLKKDKTVYLFNGSVKKNQAAQFAVLDVSTGNKNLQQCADAVMRLKAEYLFAKQQFNAIIFYSQILYWLCRQIKNSRVLMLKGMLSILIKN